MIKKLNKKSQIVFVIICAFSLTTFLSARNSEARIIFLKGKVKVHDGKKWKKAKIGQILKQSYKIKTSKKSTALLLLPKGSKLKLRSKTLLVLSKLSYNDSGFDVDINLKSGGVFSKISKRGPRDRFRLRSRTIVAGVRGTEFFTAFGEKITQNKKAEVMLCVNEGQVQVTNAENDKNSVLINQGEGIVLIPGSKVNKPSKLPWITKLNWKMDQSQDISKEISLKKAYGKSYNYLDQDYD